MSHKKLTPKTPLSAVRRGSTAESLRNNSGNNVNGLRPNPFDSHLAALPEAMSNAVFSPSVFSVVLSPSQDGGSMRSQSSSSSQFWSLEQQASLFPAEISAESPWKQETAHESVDPELENRTQEAIEAYFRNDKHAILSPPEAVRPMEVSAISMRQQTQADGSFVQQMETSQLVPECDKSTQTPLSLPPVLPPEMASLFDMLCAMSSTAVKSDMDESRLDDSKGLQTSNTSLRRRKLFDQDGLSMSVNDDSNKENEEGSPNRMLSLKQHLMSSPIVGGLVRSSTQATNALKTPDDKFKSPMPDALSYLTPIAKMAPPPSSSRTPTQRNGCALSPIFDLRSRQQRQQESVVPLGNNNSSGNNNLHLRSQFS